MGSLGCTWLFYISLYLLLFYVVMAVLDYFTFPCSYFFFTLLWLYLSILHSFCSISYVITAALGYFTFPFSYYFIRLLLLYLAILHFLVLITLLHYYVITAVLGYSTFPCSYCFITLLPLYSAILHLFVHVALEKLYLPAILYVSFLLHCYGCTQLFYGSLFLLHYYGSNQLFTHFLAVVTLLRCYGYTCFLILVVLIIPAKLGYFISLADSLFLFP